MSVLQAILDEQTPAAPAGSAVQHSGLVEMTADQYHLDPCDTPSLSSSLARILLSTSPAHARLAHPRLNPNYQDVQDDKFDVGTVAHELLLEGEAAVCVVDAADWRTKAAQEQKAAARAAGQTPLLAKDWERVEAMTNAARRQLEMVDTDPLPLTDGQPEQTLTWEDDGVWCRARFDWLHNSLDAVDDLKTTSASADPGRWEKTMFGIGADFQAAFYLRGLRKALGVTPEWRFIVQENYPPYALSVVMLAPELIAHAERRVQQAIDLWRTCLEKNHWPSYSRKPAVIQLPSWMSVGAEPAVRRDMADAEVPF